MARSSDTFPPKGVLEKGTPPEKLRQPNQQVGKQQPFVNNGQMPHQGLAHQAPLQQTPLQQTPQAPHPGDVSTAANAYAQQTQAVPYSASSSNSGIAGDMGTRQGQMPPQPEQIQRPSPQMEPPAAAAAQPTAAQHQSEAVSSAREDLANWGGQIPVNSARADDLAEQLKAAQENALNYAQPAPPQAPSTSAYQNPGYPSEQAPTSSPDLHANWDPAMAHHATAAASAPESVSGDGSRDANSTSPASSAFHEAPLAEAPGTPQMGGQTGGYDTPQGYDAAPSAAPEPSFERKPFHQQEFSPEAITAQAAAQPSPAPAFQAQTGQTENYFTAQQEPFTAQADGSATIGAKYTGYNDPAPLSGPAVMHEQHDDDRSNSRGKIIMAAVGLIGLAGAVGYGWNAGFFGGASSSEAPPLVRSNTASVKARPDNPGGRRFANTNSSAYDRMQGLTSKDDARLYPREETAVDPMELARADRAAAEAAIRKDESRIGNHLTSSDQETHGSVPPNSAPGTPRRIKTLIVRPDGTIVRPDSANDSSTMKPQVTDTVSAVRRDFSQAELDALRGRVSTSSAQAVRKIPTRPQPRPTPKPATVTTSPKPAAVKPRPTATRQAAVRQKRSARPAAAMGSGEYVAQLASQRSETEALSAYANLQQRFPSILSDLIPLIQRADLGPKGVWYRLRVGPMQSKSEAANLCNKLKRAGWKACFVRKL